MRYALCLIAGIVIGVIAQLLLPAPGLSAEDEHAASAGSNSNLSALDQSSGGGGARASRPIGDLAERQFDQPVADEQSYLSYLERHAFSKEALLGVYFLSKDDAYLEQAARRYPDDPNVQLLVISRHLFPDERREWLERFKAAQPDNLIASVFLGGDLLAQGEIEAGLAEMQLAASQTGYRDFVVENCFAMEAALIELGCPTVETKMRSGPLDVFRHVNPMSTEIRRLEALAKESADPEQQAEIAKIGLAIGRQLDSGEAGTRLLNHLVGRSYIDRFAAFLPPQESAAIELEGEVQDQLNFYTQLHERTGELSEAQFIHLLGRTRSQGAFDAMRWMSEQLDVPWEGAERWRD